MMVLITYDVRTESEGGQGRLRRVAKALESCGQRVQKSVFECMLDPGQWARLRGKLEGIIHHDEDSLRYYYLGSNWRKRVEHVGVQISYDPEGPLVV